MKTQIEMNREELLNKIDGMNERLKKLKMQGEPSNNKTLKNLRVRRNKSIKKLVKILSPEISYSNAILDKLK